MTDLSRLSEALEWWDNNKGFVWQYMTNEDWAHLERAFQATRSLLAGQDIQWCETHDCGFHPDAVDPDVCWAAGHPVADSIPCSIVPARLVLLKGDPK